MKLAVSVGELSGDEHAAAVVRALRQQNPQLEVRGMGGRHLRSVGADTVVDSEHAASVMGFSEVLGAWRRIKDALGRMQNLLHEWRPDVLLVIDYPDFHFRLVRHARRLGIKVVYYITPQVWAWRSGRVRFLAQHVDAAAVIFPFEKEFLQSHGFQPVHHVGHPFCADSWRHEVAERAQFRAQYGLDPDRPCIAFFPGSRGAELRRHLDPMLQTFVELRRRRPEVQGVGVLAPSVASEEVAAQLRDVGIIPVREDARVVLPHMDAALVKSGTSNLQAAMFDVPFAMFYIASPLAEFIVRQLVRIKEYSIVNIIRPGTIRELLQKEANPHAAADELERLVWDERYRAEVRQRLAEVRDRLGSYDRTALFEGCESAAARVARLIAHVADPGDAR